MKPPVVKRNCLMQKKKPEQNFNDKCYSCFYLICPVLHLQHDQTTQVPTVYMLLGSAPMPQAERGEGFNWGLPKADGWTGQYMDLFTAPYQNTLLDCHRAECYLPVDSNVRVCRSHRHKLTGGVPNLTPSHQKQWQPLNISKFQPQQHKQTCWQNTYPQKKRTTTPYGTVYKDYFNSVPVSFQQPALAHQEQNKLST